VRLPGEVVADEEQREAKLLLQVPKQVHDLRLDRNIEGRDRLVADDEIRFRGERAGNADALPLATGEFVRPAIRGIAWQPDPVAQAFDTRLELGSRLDKTEIPERLSEAVPDPQARVEA
jgi:hypothetical protein